MSTISNGEGGLSVRNKLNDVINKIEGTTDINNAINIDGALSTDTSLNIASSTTVDGILDEDDMSSNSATKLATQQSIKAYVDTQVGANNELSEVLANGNTTGANNIIVTAGQSITVDTISETTAANGVVIDGVTLKDGGATVTADVSFGTNDKAIFGAGSDLQIYHDGAHSYVLDNGIGNLNLRGTSLRLSDASGTHYLVANSGAEVSLTYSGVNKFATTSTGIDVTGDITLGDTNPTITFNDSSVTNLSHAIRSASDNLQIAVDVNGVDAGSRVEIFDGATEVARFSAGAVDVTGTVTADGLTVDGNITLNGSNMSLRMFESDTTDLNTQIQTNVGKLSLKTVNDAISATKNRLEIDHSTGDISFYEDTGTTAKFFWDAAAESLGIGTSSPNRPIEINTASSIGLRVEHNNGGGSYFEMGDTSGSIMLGNDAGALRIFTGGDSVYSGEAEAMRIDSSGNLLVGQTSLNYNTIGGSISAGGTLRVCSSSYHAATFNRKTSDGDIAIFYKDGAPVGSIGVEASDLTIGLNGAGLRFVDGTTSIQPWSATTGGRIDGSITLGDDSFRFKDLYLSGGVYLGGTAAANLLDDYEETNSSVTFGASTSGTVTIDSVYNEVFTTKIGHIVHVQGGLRVASISSPVGALTINMPFTFKDGPDNGGKIGGAVSFYDDSAGTWSVLPVDAGENTTTLFIQKDPSTLGANDRIYINISYRTT